MQLILRSMANLHGWKTFWKCELFFMHHFNFNFNFSDEFSQYICHIAWPIFQLWHCYWIPYRENTIVFTQSPTHNDTTTVRFLWYRFQLFPISMYTLNSNFLVEMIQRNLERLKQASSWWDNRDGYLLKSNHINLIDCVICI